LRQPNCWYCLHEHLIETVLRALIVSPHFPPVNTPDMHRVRLLLPFLRQHGVDAEVLCVAPEYVNAPKDPWLSDGLPVNVPVHRVKALPLSWSRCPGVRSLSVRARRQLARTGDQLLASGRFDVVYFSTTIFPLHTLGPRWKRRFGVPFVMDYQDPWITDYYRDHPEIVPPGGRLKFHIIDALQRRIEPRVLRECAGITSVSPAYPTQLAKRYEWAAGLPYLVQPFPGPSRDVQRFRSAAIAQEWFRPAEDVVNWVYAGAVIPGMLPVLRSFFEAVRDGVPPETRARLRMHFLGTSYASGRAAPIVMPLAHELGLAEQVRERCERLPYSEVLQCLNDADALLAFGSNDAGYSPSKVYPYLLARKPLLAIYHEQSEVQSLFARVGGAVSIPFGTPYDPVRTRAEIGQRWVQLRGYETTMRLNESALEEYLEPERARVFCGFLADAVKR
jgi:hypothetical protein